MKLVRKIWHARLYVAIAGVLLIVPLLACNSIGFIDTSASQAGLEGTVAAMNATLAAVETQQAQTPTATSTPNVIVVTATATDTPIASPTPTATATPLPTSTPVPLPPATHTPAPQGKTIVVLVTPTAPSTPTPYPNAPIIISAREGAVVAQGDEILLHWSWNGVLTGPNDYFEVKLRPDGQSRSAYIAQEQGLAHNFKARHLGEGRYQWTVQIVQGYFKNNSGHPDDWVFERFRSPESEPRLIIVVDDGRFDDDDDNHDNDDDDDGPASISQAEPPAPGIPYGLAAGGLVFVAFAALARFNKPYTS